MPHINIHLAKTDADFNAARALSFEWADWQRETFPEQRKVIDIVFEPVAYARTVADLHLIHARPKGGILLARLSGNAVGCVMYHEAATGVAEVKRLYVAPEGRGHALGKALLTGMFRQMVADSYEKVVFSSARFLVHARKLYEEVGFKDAELPAGIPPEHRDTVYAMERHLRALA